MLSSLIHSRECFFNRKVKKCKIPKISFTPLYCFHKIFCHNVLRMSKKVFVLSMLEILDILRYLWVFQQNNKINANHLHFLKNCNRIIRKIFVSFRVPFRIKILLKFIKNWEKFFLKMKFSLEFLLYHSHWVSMHRRCHAFWKK